MASPLERETVATIGAWYDEHRRDLPWRRPGTTPWGVLVSEVMLQQTPAARVAPQWQDWMTRWPTPADLAAEQPGEVVRQWGRLGYPRRALNLQRAAVAIVEEFAGEVPADEASLRSLPAVGDYTAAAVMAFAHGRRSVVLDTNIRRVLMRLREGAQFPPPGLTVGERRRAAELVPDDDAAAARWSVAVMELGALVCTSGAPACEVCPVSERCAWRVAGKPAYDGPPRRTQRFAGTDRQARGALLAVLRASQDPVPHSALVAAWSDQVQRDRCLDSLIDDELVDPLPGDLFALGTTRPT